MHSRLSYLWTEPSAAKEYTAAVSLHGHTDRSREGLYFILEYASRHPLLRFALAAQEAKALRRSSITVNFRQAHWTPPLTPLMALQLERDQIEQALGILSMVSLTDHDNIEAPLSLRVIAELADIPISVEWSAPYQNTTLHLGLHNLPSCRAESIMAQLAEYTKNPIEESLFDLLKMLDKNPEVLIILNHPMWDLAGIGRQRHMHTLIDFVAKFGNLIHAFEVSGLRSWEENRRVLDFAERWNQLVIGGGDRHGLEPSAVVNLTCAESFPAFVHEIRKEHRCHVLFMPQYAQPFGLRTLQSLLDVIREYPDYPKGSRRWDERVFHPDREGVMRPLATLWKRPPVFIEMFFSAVRILEMPPVRGAVELAMAKPQREMHFALSKGQEAATQWTQTYGSRFFRTPTTRSTAWRTPAASLKRSRRSADSTS